MVAMATSTAASPRRILILSAHVGEGHAAAAEALRRQLAADAPDVTVAVVDGLTLMGRLLRGVVEDGYRAQLRWAPWTYGLIYALLQWVPPVRWLARALLCAVGARRLHRHIAAHAPDLVVSTYPAVTVVLSRLRRRGRLAVPVVATITDPAGLFFWAQPGIDLHLVMYESSVREVERIAGAGAARLVAPLIDDAFLAPRCRVEARRALGLPADGRVAVVSGGGWGVGDVEGAVGELLRWDGTTVVCLAGRNEALEARLREAFAGEPCVRVLGFTDAMPELLAAADALVHSTGGVTCLEALARGCPVVSYGLSVGHARVNTRALARLGVVRLIDELHELRPSIERPAPSPPPGVGTARAAAAVLAARARPQPAMPVPGRLGLALASTLACLAVPGWLLATDETTSIAAAMLKARPVRSIATQSHRAALVVRTPAAAAGAVALRLRQDGVHASLAVVDPPPQASVDAVSAAGDELLPELERAGAVRWTTTRHVLGRSARELGSGRPRFFLTAARGPSVGQVLLGWTARARAVVGDVQVAVGQPLQGPVRPGDVVVASAGGSAPSLRTLDRLVVALRSDGVVPVPLTVLAASTNASTAGARVSTTAAVSSTATAPASAPPCSGVAPSASPNSSGATTIGTSV
jgi:UDP-N-acetylglucosamine:LPS N-acetylglucosamine transferase